MRISEARFALIDTETTGIDPATDAIVEVAGRIFLTTSGEEVSQIVDPRRSIPPQASGVHHLTDRDVAGMPTLAQCELSLTFFARDSIVCAHNAMFDRAFLPMLHHLPWLDTLRFAKHLYPNAPDYKLGTLRYYLGGIDIDTRGIAPHRALADVIVLEYVFSCMIASYLAKGGIDDDGELLRYVESPLTYTVMPYGKYKGRGIGEIAEADPRYCAWMLNATEDADLRATLQAALRDRAMA